MKIVKIKACGETADVNRVVYEDVYRDFDGNLVVDLEFYDNEGKHRHYKSYYDKGEITFENGEIVKFA